MIRNIIIVIEAVLLSTGLAVAISGIVAWVRKTGQYESSQHRYMIGLGLLVAIVGVAVHFIGKLILPIP